MVNRVRLHDPDTGMPTGDEQEGTRVNGKRKRDTTQTEAQMAIEEYLRSQADDLEALQQPDVKGLTFAQRVRRAPSATATLQPPHNLSTGADSH
jgi:hypothetical protein